MNKKTLITAIVLTLSVLFSGKLFAQATGTATLNIKLADARAIAITNNKIDLNFATTSDYENGVTTSVTNQIRVISSGSFQINVKSATDNLSLGADFIPANTITVTPTLNTGAISELSSFSQKLSSANQQIVKCTKGTLPISFNMEYKAEGGAYIGKAAGTYSTTVTYEILPL